MLLQLILQILILDLQRELKKMDAENIESSNEALVNFLYYTAYSILKDEKNIELWKTKVSLLNLKKAQMIININT